METWTHAYTKSTSSASAPKKRIRNYHSTWQMKNGETGETLPLKQWGALSDGLYDWDNVKYMLGDARQLLNACRAALASKRSGTT